MKKKLTNAIADIPIETLTPRPMINTFYMILMNKT